MGSWIKDRILLIDLGFYKYHLFTRIKDNGGYFVSRSAEIKDRILMAKVRQDWILKDFDW